MRKIHCPTFRKLSHLAISKFFLLVSTIKSTSSLSLIRNNQKFSSDNLSMPFNNTARLPQSDLA